MNDDQKTYLKSFTLNMNTMLIAKGSDYSGNGDTLRNFRSLEPAGYEATHAILFRINDKVNRLASLLNSRNSPNYESLEDTCLDLANYAALLSLCLNEKKTARRTAPADVVK